MKLAFVTMVWRDYWLLEKWVSHNEQYVPRRQMYVVNHGGDARVDAIASGCNVIHLPRDKVFLNLTESRWNMLSDLTSGLLNFYDRIICTDVDELIVHIGAAAGLQQHLEQSDPEVALAPMGMQLVPLDEDCLDPAVPVLQRMPDALLSARYTKPCIVAKSPRFTIGGHGLYGESFQVDPDLLLFHLNLATPELAERLRSRSEIVEEATARNDSGETDIQYGRRFWINWKKAGEAADDARRQFERADGIDVSGGFDVCHEMLSARIWHRKRKTVIGPVEVDGRGIRLTIPETLRERI